MISKNFLTAALGSMALLSFSAPGVAGQAEWKELRSKISQGQNQSGVYRDRSVYQVRMTFSRIKIKKDSWKEEVQDRRDIAMEVAPNEKREILTRTTHDSKNGTALPALASASFLEAVFFPFFPEKMKHYELAGAERVDSEGGEQVVALSFVPKPGGVKDVALVSAKGYFIERTGEILRLEITALHNASTIDPEFKKLQRFEARVDYAPADSGLRLPVKASGGGMGDLKNLDGRFRFTYQESEHKRSPFFPNP